jgi:hypothetical protein
MTTILLKPSTENIPEITDVSIRILRDSNIFSVTTSTFIVDCSISDYIRLDLMSDTTITFTNANKEGQQVTLALYQADSILHNVSFDSSVRLGTDIFSFPTISTTIGLLDRFTFIYDSIVNKYDFIGYARGY